MYALSLVPKCYVHIHSRKPPDKLEYIGNQGGNTYHEWFNGITIPEDKLNDYYVIFIYRDPVSSILSRFYNVHLDHIQTNSSNSIEDVISSGKDLFGVREFYDNYVKPNKNRNYKIYCVKYEDIFNKQDELSKILGVGELNLENKSTKKKILIIEKN